MGSIPSILLNFLRVLSFISCIYSIMCCMFLNVESFHLIGVENGFFQFVNRVVLILQASIVFMAESGYPQSLYTYFPFFDDNHGLGYIGIMQCWIGNSMLSLCKSQIANISKQDWTIFVEIPGWLILSVGVIYLILGFRGSSLKCERKFVMPKIKKDLSTQLPTSSIV
ncbi:hypothetical protein K7432_008292 [Basidiobolus ranarum]|uniref:DUF7598 domain-containing protein n=1 Tax=Basidiobolus ranarum TaxID=34480 RepID=A0ABR2WS17_9FUNG